MKLEIKNLSVASVVASPLPITLFFLSFLGGFVKFFVIPDPQLVSMTFFQKALSVCLFSLLYVVIASAVLVFAAFVYNFAGAVLGIRGIVVDIEEMHDHE